MREQQQPSSSQATAAFELGPAFVATVLLLLPLGLPAPRGGRAARAGWLTARTMHSAMSSTAQQLAHQRIQSQIDQALHTLDFMED